MSGEACFGGSLAHHMIQAAYWHLLSTALDHVDGNVGDDEIMRTVTQVGQNNECHGRGDRAADAGNNPRERHQRPSVGRGWDRTHLSKDQQALFKETWHKLHGVSSVYLWLRAVKGGQFSPPPFLLKVLTEAPVTRLSKHFANK
jgi:hypothetical protein